MLFISPISSFNVMADLDKYIYIVQKDSATSDKSKNCSPGPVSHLKCQMDERLPALKKLKLYLYLFKNQHLLISFLFLTKNHLKTVRKLGMFCIVCYCCYSNSN